MKKKRKPPAKRKNPTIRPGQKKEFHKTTQEEINKRVGEVESMLVRRMRKSQIHEFMRIKHNVEWRQTDRYMATARENLLQTLHQTKENHRCQSLGLYEQILFTGTIREKILAQERIDKLLGLEQPRTISVGGIEGAAPIKVAGERYDPRKLDTEKLIQLKSILTDAKVQTEIKDEAGQ
jgi:hypothetical protein